MPRDYRNHALAEGSRVGVKRLRNGRVRLYNRSRYSPSLLVIGGGVANLITVCVELEYSITIAVKQHQ